MISKEERAELRRLLGNAAEASPLPWAEYGDADHDAMVRSATGDEDTEHVAEFVDCNASELACAAVNALPKTLDALDAADERIAELEAEVSELEGVEEQRATEEKRHEAEFYVCEECGERKHKSNGGTDDEACDQCVEIRLLNARIAELEAAAQSRRPMSDAPKDGTWILAFTDPSSMLFKVPAIVVRWRAKASYWDDGQGGHYSNLVAWLPIPALPEGGV